MPWIPGAYAAFDDSAYAVYQGWVDSLHVGGIIVSTGSPLDLAFKLNRLQSRSRYPLLVAADLEAGTSGRLQGGTPFPSNMGLAAAGDEKDAYEMGRITALEGRAVGIHLAFAPVADVNSNPDNPIVNIRSFGEDPAQVGRYVAAEIRGIQDHGMLATVKHFPGHGDTETDSHLGLPVLQTTWGRLDSLELVPFRAAVEAGVAFVMSAHVALPRLSAGSRRPATLSPAILTGLLRDSLGFQGGAVTDALDMGGVVARTGTGEAAVEAFLAGADLLLQPAEPRVAIDALVTAVQSGRVPLARLDQSVRRMLALKLRLGLFGRRTVALDSVPMVVGSAAFLAAARDIARRSVVLLDDSAGTVDSLRAGPRRVALIVYTDEWAPAAGNRLNIDLRADGHLVSFFRLWPASGPASLDSARALARREPYVIFAVQVHPVAGRAAFGVPPPVLRLVDAISLQRRTVLVSLGSPYLTRGAKHIRSYLLGWGANAVSEEAVAHALSSAVPITGALPVSLPPRWPIGSGLHR
jgi:beta-N-acetylhexosaminidase